MLAKSELGNYQVLLFLMEIVLRVGVTLESLRWDRHSLFFDQTLFQSLLSAYSTLSNLGVEAWGGVEASLGGWLRLLRRWHLLKVFLIVGKARKVKLGSD